MYGLKQKSPPYSGLPFLVAVAAGKVPQYRIVQVFGRNPDIAAVIEDVWEFGGLMVWPSAAATISFVSSSSEDAVGGTGAQALYVSGLDSDYKRISETIIPQGLTPVVTSLSYLRHTMTTVGAVGTAGWNVGNITGTLSGNAISYLEATDGRSHQTQYTIPDGAQAWILDVRSWEGKDASVDASFMRRLPGESWIKYYHLLTFQQQIEVPGHMTDGLGSRTDIRMTAVRDGAGANINVGGTYTLLIRDF